MSLRKIDFLKNKFKIFKNNTEKILNIFSFKVNKILNRRFLKDKKYRNDIYINIKNSLYKLNNEINIKIFINKINIRIKSRIKKRLIKFKEIIRFQDRINSYTNIIKTKTINLFKFPLFHEIRYNQKFKYFNNAFISFKNKNKSYTNNEDKNELETKYIKQKKKDYLIFNIFESFRKYIVYKVDSITLISNKEGANESLLPPPPIWSRVMIWTLGSGSFFIIIWSIFTSVEETIMLQGEITTNRSSVSIKVKDQGFLTKVFIEPYQEITSGDILLSFKDEETILRLQSLRKRRDLLLSQSDKEINRFNLRVKQIKEQLQFEMLLLLRYKDLYKGGAISETQYLEKKSNVSSLKLNVEGIFEEAEASNLMYQEKIEELDNSISELLAKTKRFKVKSPIDGYIQDLKYQTPGERLQPGETIVTIIPKGDLVARIKIPSNLSAPIKIAYPASLDIDAYPSSDFGMVDAKVISLSPMSGPASNNSPQKIYIAELKILSAASPELLDISELRPGMGVTARMRLRERPIITTVFDILSDIFDPLSEKK